MCTSKFCPKNCNQKTFHDFFFKWNFSILFCQFQKCTIFVEKSFSSLFEDFLFLWRFCFQIGLQSHFHWHWCELFESSSGFLICCLWIDNPVVLGQICLCIFCNILHTLCHHGFLSQCLVICPRCNYNEETNILEKKTTLKCKKLPLLSINCDND